MESRCTEVNFLAITPEQKAAKDAFDRFDRLRQSIYEAFYMPTYDALERDRRRTIRRQMPYQPPTH